MLQNEDFQVFSKLGAALWTDPEVSRKSQFETLTAVSLMDLNPDRSLEKATTALLQKARTRRGGDSNHDMLMNPFFRLSVEPKLVLVGLHLGHWSYQRLSRILDCSISDIETMAWSARLQLVPEVPYPAGPNPMGAHCPEYISNRPWTQKFMDQELESTRERLFLQNHLIACNGCQDALSRCRTVYFAVEKLIQESLALAGSESSFSYSKLQALHRRPSERSFRESLEIFVQRKDVKWALALLVGIILWGCFHSLR